MLTATVDDRGRILLPREVLAHLGLGAGDLVELVPLAPGGRLGHRDVLIAKLEGRAHGEG